MLLLHIVIGEKHVFVLVEFSTLLK